MKKRILSALVGLVLTLCLPSYASADCLYAYKAKRDNPLKLHYGVMALSGACDVPSATQEASQRLALNGWSLLVLLERVDGSKVSQYKETAGEYFLRF